jgi:5-methylcytosine-specific restriction protein B
MAKATTYSQRAGLEQCYAAASVAVDRALRGDDSLFTTGVPIWSPEVIDDLYRRFVDKPDQSSDHFEVKFRRQLAGAPDRTIQLAGELLYFHFLIALDISGQTKRGLINEVLSWAQQPVTIPEELAEALDGGFMSTGIAFKTYRPNQLWFLLDFLRAWKLLDGTKRGHMLDDAWAFKAFVWELPIKAAQSQREGLLHLVHPETFEDTVSREYKRKIVEAFSNEDTQLSDDVDRDLALIRAKLENEAGHPINFYASPYVEQWKPLEPSPEPEAKGKRVWLVRGSNVDGRNLVPEWL